MLVPRPLMFWTTVVISGWAARRAFTKLFLDGNTGEAVTSTTMISPVLCPVLISTWRRKPYPVSSSYTFILNDGTSSRIVLMISSAF